MEIDKLQLGKRIKGIRVAEKDTLDTFAKKINKKTNGVVKSGKSNVSRWEKGENIPSDITLKAIADIGNISVNDLLYGSLNNAIVKLIQEALDLPGVFQRHEDNKKERYLSSIKLLTFQALTSYQLRQSEYWNTDIDFSSLNNTERNELVKNRKSEEKRIINNLVIASEKECIEKKVDASDEIEILKCMEKAIARFTFNEEYTTDGFINYLYSNIDDVLSESTEYLFLSDRDGFTRRTTIDEEISEKAFAIVSDAMNKLLELKEYEK